LPPRQPGHPGPSRPSGRAEAEREEADAAAVESTEAVARLEEEFADAYHSESTRDEQVTYVPG
jgi:hypothetical protein